MGYRENWFKANQNPMNLYMCASCHRLFKKQDIDIDHIVPRNKGGTDELWNLQAMCKHCNRSKQDSLNGVPQDLAVNVAKNIISGRPISNVNNLVSNIIKKNF